MKIDFNRLIRIAKRISPDILKIQKTFHITFIIRKSRIEAFGINNFKKSNRKCLDFNYNNIQKIYTHSELDAIIKYKKAYYDDCIFVNIRIDRWGRINNSRPCSGCMNIFRKIGFKKIYYTTPYGFECIKMI